jgi:broad specificity polyphosphatase/5'/3'-nucleotidase SurE
MADKIGYKKVDQTAGVQVKTGPAGLFGLIVVNSTSGSITIYDTDTGTPTGNILYAKASLAQGADLVFSGIGMAAQNGIYVVVGGTATVNVLYT